MPIRCPRCACELVRGALRCRHCGADARNAPERAELSLGLSREVEAELRKMEPPDDPDDAG